MAKTPLQPKENDEYAVTRTSGQERSAPKKELVYSDAETQYHRDVLLAVRNARDVREQARPEFNDMSYSTAIDKDYKVDLAYVPEAKNKDDNRIVSGMSREKVTTAVSVALSYDFDTECLAFDKDDQIMKGMSDASTDLVDKANRLQLWAQERAQVYRGMVALGTFFTLEVQEFPTKNYKSNIPLGSFGKINVIWDDRTRKGDVQFRTVTLDPRMVLVGNPNEPSLQKQPYVVLSRVVSETEARALFGSWDRWKYVPTRNEQVTYAGGGEDAFATYKSKYSISKDNLTEGQVEILYFMRSLEMGNELALYLNGTAMLPIKVKGQNALTKEYTVSGFPLTSWSHSGEYPIVDWHFERIYNFFYSKGMPAKTKFDQDVLDFWWQFLVRKIKRSADPTLINNSGVQITNDMLQPKTIISDIRPNSLMPLLPPEMIQGLTNGDVSFTEMLKKEIDEKTMSREFAGETQNQYQTAKQFTENQKSQLLKLGALTDGIIRGEMKRADLLLRNSIIPYWYTKQDKEARSEKIANGVAEIYDSFTLNKEDKQGKYNKVINIGSISGADSFDIMAREDMEEKRTGVRNRYTYLDPDEYDFMRTLFYWRVKPREKDNDALKRAVGIQDIATAMNLFPQEVDREKLKQKFARDRNDSYDDWFSSKNTLDVEALNAGMITPQTSNRGGANASNIAPPESLALSQ